MVEKRTVCLALAALLLPAATLRAAELREARVGNLILVAPAGQVAELDRLAAMAMTILPRLERDLGHRATAPFRVYLLPDDRRLDPDLQRLSASAPAWASGFIAAESRVGAIRLGRLIRYPYDDSASVLAHEITHQVLHDAAGPLPRWLGEGISTWEGRRWGLRDFAVQSASLVSGRLPSLEELDADFVESASRARRAYAASFDFVSWSHRRYGRDFVPRLLRAAAKAPLGDAWYETTGVTLASSEARWRRSTLILHRWLPLLASSGSLWLGVTGLALVAGFARRRRTRSIYARWDEEDALFDVAIQAAAEEDVDVESGGSVPPS